MSQQTVEWLPPSKPLEEWAPYVQFFFLWPLDNERLLHRMQRLLDNLTADYHYYNNYNIAVNVVRQRAFLLRIMDDLEECIAYVRQERIRVAEERRLRAVEQRFACFSTNSPFSTSMPHQVTQQISLQPMDQLLVHSIGCGRDTRHAKTQL